MRLIGPVLASYPVGGEGGAEGGTYISLRTGRGLEVGGSQWWSTPRMWQCCMWGEGGGVPGQGWSRSWTGWRER